MLVAIIGGNLQGVEATYLAQKAGWEVLLIDKNPQAPASLLCDRFLPLTITATNDLDCIPKQVELLIPALENRSALRVLHEWSLETGTPLAFDRHAYAISSSKKKSNRLFKEINIDTPRTWPECDFPIVVKPDRGSGSQGVTIIRDEKELATQFPTKDALNQMVAQEYLEGPSYSIEIMGSPGQYTPLQVTELHMDSGHDCKRVLAPSGLDLTKASQFEHMAVHIAERIQLKGLMDVEVILHDGRLKVLEMDARLPSQTPTAVFHSTGINMVTLLAELFLAGDTSRLHSTPSRAVLFEHIKVINDHIEVLGEHIMSSVGPLKRVNGLFGAHEVITNYHPDLNEWVATLIFKGENREEVLGKQQQTYQNIHNRVE
jgi:3-methylornithine--L-lysine ligase